MGRANDPAEDKIRAGFSGHTGSSNSRTSKGFERCQKHSLVSTITSAKTKKSQADSMHMEALA